MSSSKKAINFLELPIYLIQSEKFPYVACFLILILTILDVSLTRWVWILDKDIFYSLETNPLVIGLVQFGWWTVLKYLLYLNFSIMLLGFFKNKFLRLITLIVISCKIDTLGWIFVIMWIHLPAQYYYPCAYASIFVFYFFNVFLPAWFFYCVSFPYVRKVFNTSFGYQY